MNQITCVLLYFNNHITNSRNSQTSEVKWASLLFSSFLALILQLVKISNWSGNSWKSISLMSASEEIHTTACWPTVFWILIAHCCYSCCPAPLGKQLPLCAQHLKRHIPSTQLLCVTRFCWRFVFTRSLSEDTIQNWNFYHICIYIYIYICCSLTQEISHRGGNDVHFLQWPLLLSLSPNPLSLNFSSLWLSTLKLFFETHFWETQIPTNFFV